MSSEYVLTLRLRLFHISFLSFSELSCRRSNVSNTFLGLLNREDVEGTNIARAKLVNSYGGIGFQETLTCGGQR